MMRILLEDGKARWEISVAEDGVLSLRRVGDGYARRIGEAALAGWRRILQAWREDVQARRLCELDARALRDLGLEPYQGCSMAERIDAYRRQAELRAFRARLGF